MKLLTPKGFLTITGMLFIIISVFGFVGILGTTSELSIFGDAWWFSVYENWIHLGVGIISLFIVYGLPLQTKKFTILLGVVLVFLAVYNLFSNNIFGIELQKPGDLLFHAIFGIWALTVALKKQKIITIIK